MQEEEEFEMSTTPTPPHRQNNRGVMMKGSSLVTTTTIATTATTAASSSSSSATEPPNININNSFTDSAIDMDTSSGNITQTPDTTTNMMMTINATTPPPEESITTRMITERLLRLARLLADSNSSFNSNSDNNINSNDNKSNNLTYPHMSSSPSPSLSRQKFIAINRYLDDVEGLLLDPHDDEVRVDRDSENEEEEEEEEEEKEDEKEEEEKSEGGTTKSPSSTSCTEEGHKKTPNHMISVSSSKHPHQHPHPPPSSSVSRPEPEIEFQNGKGQSQTQRHSQVNHHNELDMLMQDLKIVTRCLEQRRTECLHLNAVFTVKCERLAQRILEMEDEIDEFRAEKIENTIELESLKGTVRGLEGWIRRWNKKRQEEADVYVDVDSEYTWSSEYSDSGRGEWGDNRNHQGRLVVVEEEEEEVSDNNGKDDIDTLMDGISAWLRGWSEVEEGFRIRARLRKRRVAMRFKKKSSEGLID